MAQSYNAVPSLWLNGRRRDLAGPHISAADRGLTLADGLFETMRARGGVVFRLDSHLARLVNGLAALDIPVVPELREWVLASVRQTGATETSIRLTVTRGVGAGGLPPPGDPQPTVIIAVNTLPAFPASTYAVGLAAHITTGRRNEYALTAGLKTLAYTENIAALIEARRAGAEEALFLDTEGHCCEATASNLFVWTGEALVTPPVSCGALAGITRAAVLETAASVGVRSGESRIELDDLLGAKEAFLTSSLRGIAPLVRVGPRAIGNGRPGPLTRELTEVYDALVSRELSNAP